MIVEVMGRTKGWIATYAGIAAGADAILVPERPVDLEAVAEALRARHTSGRTYSIVVVSEGVELPGQGATLAGVDAFGFDRLGGVGYALAPELERLTGFETRVTVLGHLQRGGTPSAFDRVLATRLGVFAADLAAAGRCGNDDGAVRHGDRVGAAGTCVRRGAGCARRLDRRRRNVLRLIAMPPTRGEHGHIA